MPVCFCFFQIKIQQPYIHVCLSVPPQHWDYRKVPSFSCGAGNHTWSLCFQDQRLAKPQPQSQRIFFMTSFFRSVLIFQPCAFDLSIWAHSDGPDGMLSLPALASLHSGVCSYQLGVTNNGVDVLLRREGEEKKPKLFLVLFSQEQVQICMLCLPQCPLSSLWSESESVPVTVSVHVCGPSHFSLQYEHHIITWGMDEGYFTGTLEQLYKGLSHSS